MTTTYTQLEAATAQLDQAITLFLEDNHLCALTLAGAAEEILGKLGTPVAVDYIAAKHGPALAAAGEPMTREEIVSSLNRKRNGAKHANAPAWQGGSLTVDWRDSLCMLLRAAPMARALGVCTDAHERLEQWLRDNPDWNRTYERA